MTRRLFFASLLVLLLPVGVAAQTETVEYYAVDAIGSVRMVFDASGNVLTRMDYTPFGSEVQTAAGLPARRFADLHRDSEAGLDYAQARSYHVRTGRFSAPDPMYGTLGEPQGWNRYAYALNAPLTHTDVTGLCPQPEVTNESSGVGVCVPFGTYNVPEFKFIGRRPRIIAETVQRPGERGRQFPTVPDGGGDGRPEPSGGPTPPGPTPPGPTPPEPPDDCRKFARQMGQVSQTPIGTRATIGVAMMQMAKADPWADRPASGFSSRIVQSRPSDVYRHLWGHGGAAFSSSGYGFVGSIAHIATDVVDVLMRKPDGVNELRGSLTGVIAGGGMLLGHVLRTPDVATRIITSVSCK